MIANYVNDLNELNGDLYDLFVSECANKEWHGDSDNSDKDERVMLAAKGE